MRHAVHNGGRRLRSCSLTGTPLTPGPGVAPRAAQVVEKFTAHYVFALGLSRFVSCAHWILQLVDGDSFLLQARAPRPPATLNPEPPASALLAGPVALRVVRALDPAAGRRQLLPAAGARLLPVPSCKPKSSFHPPSLPSSLDFP